MSDKVNDQTTDEKPQTLGLSARKAAVMGEIERVGKSAEVGWGNNKYKAATHDDVKDSLRPLMAKHGLSLAVAMAAVPDFDIITSKDGTKGTRCTVQLIITLECPEESKDYFWCGQGDDYGDKAIGKAVTYGTKTWLINNFLQSTGDPTDDPDNVASEPGTTVELKSKRAANKPVDNSNDGKERKLQHWTHNADDLKRFWTWAKAQGLDNDGVHTALRVESVKQYDGTKREAMDAITAYLADQDFAPETDEPAQPKTKRTPTPPDGFKSAETPLEDVEF